MNLRVWALIIGFWAAVSSVGSAIATALNAAAPQTWSGGRITVVVTVGLAVGFVAGLPVYVAERRERQGVNAAAEAYRSRRKMLDLFWALAETQNSLHLGSTDQERAVNCERFIQVAVNLAKDVPKALRPSDSDVEARATWIDHDGANGGNFVTRAVAGRPLAWNPSGTAWAEASRSLLADHSLTHFVGSSARADATQNALQLPGESNGFVAVPVRLQSRRLGILYVDVWNSDTYDDPEFALSVVAIAKMLGAALGRDRSDLTVQITHSHDTGAMDHVDEEGAHDGRL